MIHPHPFTPIVMLTVIFILFAGNTTAQTQSPAHMFQHTERLLREVHLIRQAQGVTEPAREPSVQTHKLPLHLYAKSLEVLEKTARAQQALGMSPVEVPLLPVRRLRSDEVFVLLETILKEVRRIKSHHKISGDIEEPEFLSDKSPADVYENLWRVSYLLDALTGPLTANHVFRNTQYIRAEIRLIADHLKVSLPEATPASLPQHITAADVLVEIFQNLYRVATFEQKIGLAALHPPQFPTGEIIPSDPYDASSLLLTELVRIKVELEITQPVSPLPLPEGKTSTEVYKQVLITEKHMETLLNHSS